MTDLVELYTSGDGTISLQVRADGDTVWLSRRQLAQLFSRDIKTIGKHIGNALREELDGVAVVAKFATTATDGKTYQTEHYSLDMVLSVGYRVKSAEGIHFRRWANDVLRKYLLQGAALNERRLQEIGKIITILGRSDNEMIAGVADVLTTFLPSLALLRDYDAGVLNAKPRVVPEWQLTLDEARRMIARVACEFPSDALLGNERGEALSGIIEAIYQSFDGEEVYPTAEEKAANLLYFVIKDHPLLDGNKRCAASLFVTFLANNQLLYDAYGNALVNNNTLASLTLLIAMSKPQEKELMVALVIRMLSKEET